MPELADSFEVSDRTLRRWMRDHPEFRYAIKTGKEFADVDVEMSLLQRAKGYRITEVKRTYEMQEDEDGNEVRVLLGEEVKEKDLAPDPTSMIFWLKNRKPQEWRDRRELTGADGEQLVQDVPLRDIAIKLLSLVDAGLDEERLTH